MLNARRCCSRGRRTGRGNELGHDQVHAGRSAVPRVLQHGGGHVRDGHLRPPGGGLWRPAARPDAGAAHPSVAADAAQQGRTDARIAQRVLAAARRPGDRPAPLPRRPEDPQAHPRPQRQRALRLAQSGARLCQGSFFCSVCFLELPLAFHIGHIVTAGGSDRRRCVACSSWTRTSKRRWCG